MFTQRLDQGAFARIRLGLICTLVIVLFSLTARTQAQGCVAAPGGRYVNSPGTYLASPIAAYSDAACANRSGTVGVGSFGWVYGSFGVSTAAQLCRQVHGDLEDVSARALSASNFFSCTVSGRDGSGGGKRSGDGAARSVRFEPGLSLPLAGLRLRAFDGPESGIQFKRIGIYYVGSQPALDMGFLDAVDVWGHIGSGYVVCFPQLGRIVFLDAATAPRSLVNVEYAHDEEGYTCASLDRAGTLVLVGSAEGQPPPEAETAPNETEETDNTAIRQATDDPLDTAIDLEGCSLTTTLNLRLRRRPWSGIRAVIPSYTTLDALARTEHWFKVIYDDRTGWIAGWHTWREGVCDWT